MQSNLRSEVVQSIRRRLDPQEYRAIRKLWIAHSMAEEAHDIPGLMATLTEDCVYTVANTGTSWHGKAAQRSSISNYWVPSPMFISICRTL
jgi:ketosteroid isomerase-like protein